MSTASVVRSDEREPCLWHLVARVAEQSPDAAAISAPGRPPLSYGRLERLIRDLREQLNALGIGPRDRVALLVPNGPELAVACLAVASSAVCAPLNPSYRAGEFEAYLSTINARVLLIQADMTSPARTAAGRLGIPVVRLVPDPAAEAGVFTLAGEARGQPAGDEVARPSDTALILPTSGTTARPRIVPLTHANLCAAAGTIATSLALTCRDRSLNIMPLFHVHGLMAGVLAPLAAGASVMCLPGFDPPTFLRWLETFGPTWYTAVPTMHQAILAAWPSSTGMPAGSSLRFIRSCSAPLPPRTMAELERIFGVPVIEAYGMTEAAHQISSNPLPPRQRKAGSVGVPTGCEAAIMAGDGALLERGHTGEIVIRGPNVMSGYENDPVANDTVFRNGWFRTGDLGVLDSDGYLFITGRLKELINRAGTKISPYEIEQVLLEHPHVAQAVAFPVPHATLGEDVGAAVVLRDQAAGGERDLRAFAAARLSDQKLPTRLLIVDDLPKGGTGKLQRGRLAQQLGLLLKPPFVAPRDHVEEALARIWCDVLGVGHVGVHENFFELGGDSLSAVLLFVQVGQMFGRDLPIATLFRAATIAELAEVLRSEGRGRFASSLVDIQPNGRRPPFFCVHGAGGNVLNYRDLARHLGSDQPFYALQARGVDGRVEPHTSVEAMATSYLEEIRAFQPRGPYFLGGHSFGGLVAYEMAQQLLAQGERVALLALIDTYLSENFRYSWLSRTFGQVADFELRRARHHWNAIRRLRGREKLAYLRSHGKAAADRLRSGLWAVAYRLRPALRPPRRVIDDPLSAVLRNIERANHQAADRYVPRPYPGPIVLLQASIQVLKLPDPQPGWARLAAGGLRIYRIPGGHATLLQEPQVRALAQRLRICLDEAGAIGDS